MEHLTIDNLLLLAIFFLPGFIYLKTYGHFIADTKTDFSKDFYEAIGISFINAIIFAYPIYYIYKNGFLENHAVLHYFIITFIILVAPIIWALLYYILSKKKWFSNHLIDPQKSTWDKLFSNKEPYWIIITLKNGKKIGGKYGIHSHTSAYPLPEEIYIQDVWEIIDDKFVKSIPSNSGALITSNEISTILFFR